MTKRIVLCADDYGQATAISSAIIQLVDQKRLSATSCLVNFDSWRHDASILGSYQGQIDIGLHFNLTEGRSLASGKAFYSLPKLLLSAHLGNLNSDDIEKECHAQLDHFINTLGFLPDFLDGHQHVHQFPVIRDAFLRVYQSRFKKKPAYVRWVGIKPTLFDYLHSLKTSLIYHSGTRPFKHLLERFSVPHNTSFTGIYPFKGDYRRAFKGFLQHVQQGGIIMCHPGFQVNKQQDKITKARGEEYQYLMSPGFSMDCESANVCLARFSNT